MLSYELYKLFIKNHFLILFIILIILKAFSYNLSNNDNETMSKNDKIYAEELLNKMQGELNYEKECILRNEIDSLYSAKADSVKLNNDLINKKYTSLDIFSSKIKQYIQIIHRENAISYVNDIFLYANQDRQNRWILTGDLSALENDNTDFLLLAYILLVSIYIYYQEENSNMLCIIKTNKTRLSVSKAKLKLICTVVVSTCIIFMLLDFIYIGTRVNISEILAPIQSLRYYANCQYQINIMEAVLLIWFVRIIGILFIAYLSSAIYNITKKTILSIFVIISIYIIEPLLFEKNTIYYTPFCLLKAVGFIRGSGTNIVNEGMLTETVIINFNEIPLIQTVLVIISSIAATISMMAFCYNYYSINYRGELIMLKIKKFGLCSLLLIILLMMTACNKSDNDSQISVNIKKLNIIAQNNKSYFYRNNESLKMVVKNNGIVLDILKNPFLGSSEIQKIDKFACTNKYIYYIISKSTTDDIYRINLDNYCEEHILSTDLSSGESFLGLKHKDKSYGFANNIKLFFVADDNLIYILTKDSNYLFCYNINKNKVEIVLDDGIYNNNIVLSNDAIYYINSFYELKKLNINTNNAIKITNECYNSLYLHDGILYITNLSGIYYINTVKNKAVYLCDIITDNISSDGKNIFYMDENRKLFMLKDNAEGKLIFDRVIYDFDIIHNTNNIIVFLYINNNMEKKIISY